jgi:hypothetical protein
MAKNDKKPLKAAQWYGIAEQFMRGAWLLGEHSHKTGDHGAVLSELTARAFCTEGYLKCLLTIRKKDVRTIHDLEALYGNLPPADQKYIRSEWDKRVLPIVLGAAKNMPEGAGPAIRTFEEALNRSKDAFIEWRYQQHLGATWYLGNFPFFVRDRILRSRPKWVASPPNFFGKFAKPKLGKQKEG